MKTVNSPSNASFLHFNTIKLPSFSQQNVHSNIHVRSLHGSPFDCLMIRTQRFCSTVLRYYSTLSISLLGLTTDFHCFISLLTDHLLEHICPFIFFVLFYSVKSRITIMVTRIKWRSVSSLNFCLF